MRGQDTAGFRGSRVRGAKNGQGEEKEESEEAGTGLSGFQWIPHVGRKKIRHGEEIKRKRGRTPGQGTAGFMGSRVRATKNLCRDGKGSYTMRSERG